MTLEIDPDWQEMAATYGNPLNAYRSLCAEVARLKAIIVELRYELKARGDDTREEVARLDEINQALWKFLTDSDCECYDEYGQCKPRPCERCRLINEYIK